MVAQTLVKFMPDEPTKTEGNLSPTGESGMVRPPDNGVSPGKSSWGIKGITARILPQKKPVGRPRKEVVDVRNGLAPIKIKEPTVAPPKPDEMEERRRELENLLKEILVGTTNDAADHRFAILKKSGDIDLAKTLSDKKRLSKNESDVFSKMAVRLAEKYIGNGWEYSEEIMCSAMVLHYFLRNREGDRMVKEIKAEHEKRVEVQSPAPSNPGHDRNGKNGAVFTVRSTAPSTA
jgi:hypothetical protein